MDTPTHAIIGRLAARCLWPQKAAGRLANIATITSILPDLDVFIPGDSFDMLVTHRGLSHSMVGILAGSFIVAFVAKFLGCRDISRKTLFGAAVLGWAIHVFFDVLTSYGTVIFLPASDMRVALDTLFVIDPYVDVFVIAGLLFGRFSRWGGRAYRAGMLALAAYVLFGAGLTLLGHSQAADWVEENEFGEVTISVMPTPFSPLHRRVLVRGEKQSQLVSLTPLNGEFDQPLVGETPPKTAKLEAFWRSREGRIMKWFMRYPVVERTDSPRRIFVRDLSYRRSKDGLGWLGQIVADQMLKNDPKAFENWAFSVEVIFDEKGQVESVRFL